MGFLTIPPSLTRFRLANARVPVSLVADPAQLVPDADGLASCDIVIEKEGIAAIDPASAANDGLPQFDLDGGIALPRLVDVHTHIDKGQIWHRAENPDGTHMGARMAVMADREKNWSREDVAKRMDFALRCAFAHGTGALRTHIDSYPAQTPISWPVFAEMREHWKGRIALQAVSLCPIDMVADEVVFRALVATVAKYGGILGGLTFMGEAPNARTDAMLDSIFQAAIANGLDLDFHVDESDSPKARSARSPTRRCATGSKAASSRAIAARSRSPTTTSALPLSPRSRRPASRSSPCRCAICTCRIAWRAARRAGAASPRCMSSMPRA
jgi:cytosine deaminase